VKYFPCDKIPERYLIAKAAPASPQPEADPPLAEKNGGSVTPFAISE